MSYILDLQGSATDREQSRDISTTSNWLCYSTTSWFFC
ncbi:MULTISPECIES: SapB/AmfS family lanthipeptide [Cellulomonas]|nr:MULTISPECIES: SapB/AmfS family lanthipeptide [Cellulomonas]